MMRSLSLFPLPLGEDYLPRRSLAKAGGEGRGMGLGEDCPPRRSIAKAGDEVPTVMPPLTLSRAFVCISAVKWLALLLLVVLQCSCTTLANRRDLYSPDPGPDSKEMARRTSGTTTTTTTTTTHSEELPAPEFRY